MKHQTLNERVEELRGRLAVIEDKLGDDWITGPARAGLLESRGDVLAELRELT